MSNYTLYEDECVITEMLIQYGYRGEKMVVGEKTLAVIPKEAFVAMYEKWVKPDVDETFDAIRYPFGKITFEDLYGQREEKGAE